MQSFMIIHIIPYINSKKYSKLPKRVDKVDGPPLIQPQPIRCHPQQWGLNPPHLRTYNLYQENKK